MVSTLVVGIDAATFRRLKPLLESGDLPRMGELCQDGNAGTLTSTLPPMTPQAWTTISTGTNPGEHGILDFRTQNQDTYQISPVDYSTMVTPTVWDHFAATDQTIGVVNYPMVYPPSEQAAFFVSGIPASSDEKIASPPAAQAILDESKYRVKPERTHEENSTTYFTEVKELATIRTDVSLTLAQKYNPDVLWTIFMAVDWIQHYLWDVEVDGEDAVDMIYEHLDKQIDRLVSKFDPDYVIILSDHGAQKIAGEVHLNSLLEEWGYLTHRSSSEGLQAKLQRFMFRTGYKIGQVLPFGLRQQLKRRLPDAISQKARKAGDVGQRHMDQSIVWDETTAFSFGSMGRIFIHSEDRYPRGTVPKDARDRYIENLMRRLLELRDPQTDTPIVDEVHRGEEVYRGSHEGRFPDIVFSTSDWQYMTYGDFGEEAVHEPRYRIADHDATGVFIAAGDDIAPGSLDLDVEDVAPTVLHLHKIPIHSEMTGTVRRNLFCGETGAREPSFVDEVSIGERTKHRPDTAAVESRLEDLGYL